MYKRPATYHFTKQKLWTAVLLIWIYAAIAITFVYSQNKSSFAAILLNNTISPLLKNEKTANAAAGKAEQDTEQAENSYVLIQYNKKLMFTRYSNLVAGVNFGDSVISSSAGKTKPLIIRRSRTKPATGKNKSFDIKPVPK
jgi:hypothetical protein